MKQTNWVSPLLGFGLLALSTIVCFGQNGGQPRVAVEKEARAKIQELAAAIKAGDKAAIKNLSAELSKLELDDIMALFKPRFRGVGKKGVDGIELTLVKLARDAPAATTIGKEAKALEEMAYEIAAIAEATLAKGPLKARPGVQAKWNNLSKEMKDGSELLIKAIKSRSGSEVQNIVIKINNNCSACHAQFK